MKKLFIVLSLLFVPLLASASFDANLYYGLQNNNNVKEMQEFLTDQGVYAGPITGNFYSLTLKAVKDFQRKERISPTSGFFGPLTRQKANDILSTNVEPSNQQAIQETGSTPPSAEPAKTTNDVVKSLQDQISLLMQQIQTMQAQQTSVQQLQQTVQQIQQNTQQIVQNTTPAIACSPSWQCGAWSACSNSTQTRLCADSNNCGVSTGKPSETQSCTNPIQTPVCKESSLQIKVSPTNPAAGSISINNTNNIKFTDIKFSAGVGEGRNIDKIVVTRDGGTDNMFSSVSLMNGSALLGSSTVFNNGKAEFNLRGLENWGYIPQDASKTISIFAKLDSAKAAIGTSVRLGINDASDVVAPDVCDSAINGNTSVTGALMGNYMTIGE